MKRYFETKEKNQKLRPIKCSDRIHDPDSSRLMMCNQKGHPCYGARCSPRHHKKCKTKGQKLDVVPKLEAPKKEKHKNLELPVEEPKVKERKKKNKKKLTTQEEARKVLIKKLGMRPKWTWEKDSGYQFKK